MYYLFINIIKTKQKKKNQIIFNYYNTYTQQLENLNLI